MTAFLTPVGAGTIGAGIGRPEPDPEDCNDEPARPQDKDRGVESEDTGVKREAKKQEDKDEEEEEEEEEWSEESARVRVARFFNSTSIHGVGRIYGFGRWWRRAGWFCLWACMTVWALYQLSSVAVDYAKYPKKTTRSTGEDRVLEFPGVTVCNLSPLPRTPALATHPIWGAFLTLEQNIDDPVCNYDEERSVKNTRKFLKSANDDLEEMEKAAHHLLDLRRNWAKNSGNKFNQKKSTDGRPGSVMNKRKWDADDMKEPRVDENVQTVDRDEFLAVYSKLISTINEMKLLSLNEEFRGEGKMKFSSVRRRLGSAREGHRTEEENQRTLKEILRLAEDYALGQTLRRDVGKAKGRQVDEKALRDLIHRMVSVFESGVPPSENMGDGRAQNIRRKSTENERGAKTNLAGNQFSSYKTILDEDEGGSGRTIRRPGSPWPKRLKWLLQEHWSEVRSLEGDVERLVWEDEVKMSKLRGSSGSARMPGDSERRWRKVSHERREREDSSLVSRWKDVDQEKSRDNGYGNRRWEDGYHEIRRLENYAHNNRRWEDERHHRRKREDGRHDNRKLDGGRSGRDSNLMRQGLHIPLLESQAIDQQAKNDPVRDLRTSNIQGECGPGYLPCGDGTCYREHEACDVWPDCANKGDENCTCGPGYFTCRGTRELCIAQELVCDGYPDCMFDDDELGCDACGPGAWLCAGDRCIRDYLRCDGHIHCREALDEQCGEADAGVECSSGQFRCDDARLCVAQVARCDSRNDCSDGNDELNCDVCDAGLHHCDDNTCVPDYLLCDGYEDCSDGSDEANCSSWSWAGCPDDHHQCNDWWTQLCIHQRFVCDGHDDCLYGDDEDDCGTCRVGLFLCPEDDRCVPEHLLCNGFSDCPEGQDERNCSGCSGRSFHCAAEAKCIGQRAVCDGVPDCADETDEQNCEKACPPGYVSVCGDGRCLHTSFLCDADFDCYDFQDEKNCEACAPGRFLCEGNGRCIHQHRVCDGVNHCSNATDEAGCGVECGEGYLACEDDNNKCVHEMFVCDGVNDCWHGDDEADCETCPEGVVHCSGGRCVDAKRKCDGFPDCPEAEDERECSGCQYSLLCKDLLWTHCLPLEKMCDGEPDCSSGIDELLCSEYVEACPTGYYKCNDSVCVRDRYRCDGEADCFAGEDEEDCEECVDGAYHCEGEEGRCIPYHRLCDGLLDCPSHQDEDNCSVTVVTCPPGYVECGEGGCLNPRFLCDGWQHCPEAQDELYCGDVTTMEGVHAVRQQCSQNYRDLLALLNVTSAHSPPGPADCKVGNGNYSETPSWSVMCQFGVFCDQFGCYDTSLRRYQETTPDAGVMCSKCGGTADVCWPCGWIRDWSRGRLDNDTLTMMLRKQRADFVDIQDLYVPSNSDQELYSVAARDLVYSCSFDSNACDFRSFYTWTSDTHGMCYTFNAHHDHNLTLDDPYHDPASPRTTTRVGPKNGLRLALNVPLGLSLLSPDVGLRVVVHSPRLLPVPQEEGFNVGPGASSISVSRTVFTRLGRPHGECGHHHDPSFQYSSLVCKQVCVEREYRRRCRCYVGVSPIYKDLEEAVPTPQGRCSSLNATQKLCMDMVSAAYLNGSIYCDCPQPCRETRYLPQVTSSLINDRYYGLLHQSRKRVKSLCSADAEMATLHIYLDSKSFELFDESPTYTWDTLLSNLGGSLGLFVGVSMVSLMEVLELLLDLLILGIRRPHQPLRRRPSPTPAGDEGGRKGVRSVKVVPAENPEMAHFTLEKKPSKHYDFLSWACAISSPGEPWVSPSYSGHLRPDAFPRSPAGGYNRSPAEVEAIKEDHPFHGSEPSAQHPAGTQSAAGAIAPPTHTESGLSRAFNTLFLGQEARREMH